MKLPDKIRFLREELMDLDATEFSQKCGVNRRTIYSWENGESVPCLDNIAMIALVCNVTVNYLLDESCPLQFYCFGVSQRSFNILKETVENYHEINKIKKESKIGK